MEGDRADLIALFYATHGRSETLHERSSLELPQAPTRIIFARPPEYVSTPDEARFFSVKVTIQWFTGDLNLQLNNIKYFN